MTVNIRSKIEGQMVHSTIYLLDKNILNIETSLSIQKRKDEHPKWVKDTGPENVIHKRKITNFPVYIKSIFLISRNQRNIKLRQ